MVNVQVDKENKWVEAQLTGLMKQEEAIHAANELKKALIQFGPKDAVLLLDIAGLTPFSNDILPILRGLGRDVIAYFRKAALVQDFAMDFGGRKLIEAPPGYPLPSYPTREKAIAYLKE